MLITVKNHKVTLYVSNILFEMIDLRVKPFLFLCNDQQIGVSCIIGFVNYSSSIASSINGRFNMLKQVHGFKEVFLKTKQV